MRRLLSVLPHNIFHESKWEGKRRSQQQVRKRNKIRLVICCCLKNCACISSPPPSLAVGTLYILSFPTDLKRKKTQAASFCPPNPAVIHSVMFSGLCRLFLYTAAFHDPSTWVHACQNLGQNVLAACSLWKSSYSLYSTCFHLQLLQFDKEEVQLVFTTWSLETYILWILFLAICMFSNFGKKRKKKYIYFFFFKNTAGLSTSWWKYASHCLWWRLCKCVDF